MSNVLIVSGHTDLNDSVANKTILEELSKLLPEAQIDYLDQLYPDFQIDVPKEQAKVENADIIVLQFPIFWYAMPSLLQRWMEETFLFGWSHGDNGDKLKGKKLIASFTTGAPESLYHQDAPMGHEINEFLAPIEATCALCQMDFAGWVYTGGVSYQMRTNPEALSEIKQLSAEHAARVVQLVQTLQDEA